VIKDALQTLRFYFPENSDVAPVNGDDYVLTIDSRVQRILQEELERGLTRYRADTGLGVVMDCRNGDILGMASVPCYDPGEYHNYPREEREKRRANRVIESTFEPGSDLKPCIASWALRSGVVRRDEVIWEGGKAHRFEGRRRVTDVKDNGPLTMEEAVFKSSNIGMAFLGLRLGQTRIRQALEQFGFGRPTGVNLPGEVSGFVQSPAKWSELYTSVSVSFGYEIRATPLQLATAFCAVVNGGTLYRPRLVLRKVRDGEVIENPTVVRGHPISPEVSRDMREILVRVVEDEGTGKYLRMDGFRFGGKSGTADIGRGGYTKTDYLTSFEAFAPYEDPEIVVLVMYERPRTERRYGGWVAGPVVAQVLRRYFLIEDQPLLVKLRYDEP
jgi:cell division protein FtsI/penicillin-binding protein 2